MTLFTQTPPYIHKCIRITFSEQVFNESLDFSTCISFCTSVYFSSTHNLFSELWGHCTNGDRYGCVRHGRNGLLPPVMSGKIKSKHVVKYGKVTVRAKIPKGDWIWPGKYNTVTVVPTKSDSDVIFRLQMLSKI